MLEINIKVTDKVWVLIKLSNLVKCFEKLKNTYYKFWIKEVFGKGTKVGYLI